MIHHLLSAILTACVLAACGVPDSAAKQNSTEIATVPATPSAGLEDWRGYYQMDSAQCTPPSDEAPCSKELKDCLRIEPIRGAYHVEVYSTQAYQHICAFSIDMREEGGRLVFDSPLGQVSLRKAGNQLVIASDGIDPTAGGLGFCGVHADINGLEFPLSEKIETSARCFNDGP